MKAEEHPLSQKPEHPYSFGEKLTAHQRGRIVGYKEGAKELLKAEQELKHLDLLLDEHVKESIAKDLKIQELEETISHKDNWAKLCEESIRVLEIGIKERDAKLEASEVMIKYGISEYEILKKENAELKKIIS